jgi:glutathione S-transferase
LQIYGDSISGNCLKVKWTCDLIGRSYDWIEMSVTAGDTRTPAFLAINPVGQVPAIVFDDGRALAQSNAIILHLAEGSALIPADPFARAKMLEWMFWEQYSHEPYVAVVRFQVKELGKSPGDLEPRLYERSYAALQRLEDALTGGGPFLLRQPFTLADISLVAYTRMARDGDLALDRYPGVLAWIARVEGRLGIGAYAP